MPSALRTIRGGGILSPARESELPPRSPVRDKPEDDAKGVPPPARPERSNMRSSLRKKSWRSESAVSSSCRWMGGTALLPKLDKTGGAKKSCDSGLLSSWLEKKVDFGSVAVLVF